MNGLINIAIVGADSEAGEAAVALLKEREFSVDKLHLLTNNAGDEFANVADFNFDNVDLVLFFTDDITAQQYIPRARKAGCKIVDMSSFSSCKARVPLVVPEVNAELLTNAQPQLVASPSCISIEVAVALKPIVDLAGIKHVGIAAYRAVSDFGRPGVDELAAQTAELLNGQSVESSVFAKQIAFNILPAADEIDKFGNSGSERRVIAELHKIFNKKFTIMCDFVYVPVFYGDSCSIYLKLAKKVELAEIKSALRSAPGIIVIDDDDYPTPRFEGQEQDAVYIGRIKQHPKRANLLSLWVVADNIRKGAALNVIQIAELIDQL